MKTIFKGVKYSTKVIVAFAVGQITQLVLQGLVISLNLWDSRRIPFCGAAGFIILFAVLVGVRIASRETANAHYEDLQ